MQSQALEEAYGQASWAEFVVRSSADAAFDHYGAFEDGDLVGAAGLYHNGEIGYLGWAGVAKSHRGQGGQNGLIAARTNRASELGYRWVCSETLYMLKTSLRNLQRNGFEVLYDKEVYVWKRE